MRKTLSTLLYLFIFPISLSFATPPTSITLTYDSNKGNLHVEAVHPSYNLEKSYVRLMNVYVNEAQVSTLNYFKQNDYNGFTDDVPVTAQAGDVIKVDLFCSEGGEMAQEITVSKSPSVPAPQNNGAGSAKYTADNAAI